jgi:macrolide transport system ATP-binding/permease protein
MIVIEVSSIQYSVGDRLLFEVPKMTISTSDRVGIVGTNGAGKTTLLEVLAGRRKPDEGKVDVYGSVYYVPQLENPDEEPSSEQLDPTMARVFGAYGLNDHGLSGGERTRRKLAAAFSQDCHALLSMNRHATSMSRRSNFWKNNWQTIRAAW